MPVTVILSVFKVDDWVPGNKHVGVFDSEGWLNHSIKWMLTQVINYPVEEINADIFSLNVGVDVAMKEVRVVESA